MKLHSSSFAIFAIFLHSIASDPDEGACWRLGKGGNSCGRLLRRRITKEKCCTGGQRRSFSASALQFASSAIFYVPGDNVCESCAASCHEVKCGEDEECIVKKGVPKCVCSPKCHLQKEQQVCGTDGRTYRSECHLLKRSCRKKKKLRVAHKGACQSCHGMRCHEDRVCVVDEHMIPHCIKSPKSCNKRRVKRPICGADGLTYPSRCAMKVESCKKGRMIAKAYKGRCKKHAACHNIRCWNGEKCLNREDNKGPHCWFCGDLHNCKITDQPVCTSDGRIFQSRCAFRHESCRSGKALIPFPLHYCTLGQFTKKTEHDCELLGIKENVNTSMKRTTKRIKKRRRGRKGNKKKRPREKKITKKLDYWTKRKIKSN